MMSRNTSFLSYRFRRCRPFHCRGRRLSLAPRSLSAFLILALLIPALLTGCAGGTKTADAPALTAEAAAYPKVGNNTLLSPESNQTSSSSKPIMEDTRSLGPFYMESSPRWNSRYAVALYGIQQDEILIENGEEPATVTAGLTFGPATGRSFQRSYRAHIKHKAYLEDPEANLCLHWMTWEEIAEQSLRDPTAFQPCLEYGCTHGVDLYLNSRLLSRDWYEEITGDGAGALLDGVKREFLCWNADAACADGWPACRARTVLNGADEFTNAREVGKAYMLSSEESLFSCFPEALKLRIAPKAVVSDLNNDKGKSNCVTTYDRLWLFSKSEVYGAASHAEGASYQRTLLIRSGKARFGGGYRMYSESGNEAYAWLRSISPLAEVINRHIYGGGHRTGSGFYNVFALTPGFCLP